MSKRRAVFLDRDGTVNKEVNYLRKTEELELLPGAGEAIARLNKAGFAVVVVSNQSGVGRGIIKPIELAALEDKMNRLLKEHGAVMDAYYYCPHHPEAELPEYREVCACRKPEPGLVLSAAKDMDLELKGSYLVGDRYRDVASGNNAGLTSLMVRSGLKDDWQPSEVETPAHIVADLAEAVEWIMAREQA